MKKILALLILIVVIAGYWYFHTINKTNDNAFGEKEFRVEKGQGVDTIAKNLEGQRFLKSKLGFKIYLWTTGEKGRLVDGEYQLQTDWTIKQIVKALLEQPKAKEVSIKFIEGWNVSDMDEYLAKEMIIKAGDLISYSQSYKEKDYEFLTERPKSATLEGYLYPDTYRIYKKTDLATVVNKMLNNFDAKLTAELRQQIKDQKKSIHEVLILASIVEKEMYGYENRRIVAGIFKNRLKIGMPLQSDATVNFITNKGTTRPSLDDTKIDNPYNTYKNQGLPPGPICNPSIEAIKAVVNAADTDYLFFLTTKDNRIIYGRTYEEHLSNIRKYLN